LFVIGLISIPTGKLPEGIIGLDFRDIIFSSSCAEVPTAKVVKNNIIDKEK